MSTLGDARQALVDLLKLDDGQVLGYVPETVAPPCIVLEPGENYVGPQGDDDATFGAELAVSLDAWVLVDLVDNEAALTQIEDLLEALTARLAGSSWWITSITKPGPVHTSEWLAYGVRVSVGSWITL